MAVSGEWKLRYEAAVRAGRLILYDWDLTRGEVTWGGEVESILGYRIEEMGDVAWAFDQIHPEDRPDVETEATRMAATRIPTVVQYRLRRKDGRYIVVEDCTEVLAGSDGQRSRLIGFVRDITERKRAEEQLQRLNETLEDQVTQRTLEAERRTAEIHSLASELTRAEQRERRRLAQFLHDHLQQLLVAARMKVGILRKEVEPERLQSLVDTIDQLLHTCIEASRSLTMELSPPILHDHGLVAALQWLTRWVNDKHGLTVDLQVQEQVEPADENIRMLLFEIVRELLFNVVKHARARRARVQLARCGTDQIEILVVDDGLGFDTSLLEGSAEAASGFGLFSIHHRLELIGGQMEVQSGPGQGTCTCIRSPLGSAEQPGTGEPEPEPEKGTEAEAEAEAEPGILADPSAPATAPQRVPEAGERTRVLLADDHEIFREGLASLLQQQSDLEVIGHACDGQIALELARQLQPDVVVMDVDMPRLSGIEATRQITIDQPRIKVIGLSLYDDEFTEQAMLAAGASTHLTKEKPLEALLAAIRVARG